MGSQSSKMRHSQQMMPQGYMPQGFHPGMQPGMQPGYQPPYQPGFQPGMQPGMPQGYYPPFGQPGYPQYPTERKKRRRKSNHGHSRSTEMYNGGYVPSQGGAPRGFIPTHQEGSEAHYASAAIYQQPQRSQGPSVNFPSAAGSAPAQRASRPIHTPYPSAMPSLNPESEAAGPGLGFQPGMAPSQMQQPQSLYAEGTREPDVARILQPITPAQNPSVYGPPGSRQMPPLRNPLPPPPRDLYELSPYKSLINDLTQTTALLTASYSSQPAAPAAPRRSKTGLFGGKKSGGLFRSLSSARREPNSPTSGQPDVRFVPVFVPSANVASSSTVPAPNNIGQSNPGAFTAGAGPSQSIPPIRFSQAENNPFSGFINHSPHRITYNGVLYPTATHLFEAMKFPHRRDMAEQIRLARNVGDVYPLSASFEQEAGIRPDWSNAFGSIMEDVLHMKFKQHAELRDALLSTGLAPIIYEDPNDTFWGEGPTGQFGATPGRNELGKCLVRVRQKLRDEQYPSR